LDAFRRLCEPHRDSTHEKTRALARAFLNDWEAVWIVVAHLYLPLTNNEAERALRHWVIARRLSHRTRTEQGSRAFALLASVIDTCRRRGSSYLKIGWQWLKHALNKGWQLMACWRLRGGEDPDPARASRRQYETSQRKFKQYKHETIAYATYSTPIQVVEFLNTNYIS
jgi:hypothetical protein